MNVAIPEVDQVSSCVVDSTMLWHQRMGHISEKNLQTMPNKGMVEGVPDCSRESTSTNIVFMVSIVK